MIILPPSTKPPREPFETRHAPSPAKGENGYRAYRACLRWDFGFSCPFCLLHEADFAWQGAEGLGIFWVEHHYPVSTHPDETNRYENCLYSCKLCNRARSDTPVTDARGRRLLNPRIHAWVDHFELALDELRPKEGDADAEYTFRTYDIGDQRKIELRQLRRKILEECYAVLERGPQMMERLVEKGDAESLRAAEALRECVRPAEMIVKRYAAIPTDADHSCRCGRTDHHSLPAALRSQCREI